MAEAFKITVKLDAATDQLKPPISESRTINVDGLFQIVVTVPKGGRAVELDSIPESCGAPQVLILRPIFPDPKAYEYSSAPVDPTKPNAALKPSLEYSSEQTPPEKRKPLEGTHLFINGMSEWVTDSVSTPLKSLFFWNNLVAKPVDGHTPASDDDLAVKVLIVIGFTPKVGVPAAACKP